MSNKLAVSVVFVFIFSFIGFAQDPAARDPELIKARRAKIIDSMMRDAGELRLPENRAFISTKLGAQIWKEDQERASTLFKNAIADLIVAQGMAESNKNPNQQNYDLLNSQSLRPSMLNLIASVDAEFALSSLYRTRPSAIQKALAQSNSNAKINSSSYNFAQLAQQEITLEQRFIRLLAEQKPERSIAFLKESIKKNLSGETFEMLKKVWGKDPASGNELANEVVDRLISKSFVSSNNLVNYDLINLTNTLFADYLRERSPEERSIAFAESGMRSLAGKLLSTYIERGGAIGYIPLDQLAPIAKRFSPGSFELLKKVAVNTRGYGSHGIMMQDESYTKLMSSNPTAETLVVEAKKFPIDTRRSMYIAAANKLSDVGQYDRAIALLNDNFEGDALENAISSVNWYYAHLLVNRGDYDAAEAMMMQFNDSNRISALISLASNIYSKDPDANRSRAISILQRARTFLPTRPETSNELNQLVQLINSMAAIEPTEAFRNFEPVIDQMNQLTEAWAIVSAFQGGNIRQGEYMLSGGFSFGFYIDPSTFTTLAKKDFDRTLTLIDGLQRREMRVLLLASLLESGF
jgi:hypothetical protein